MTGHSFHTFLIPLDLKVSYVDSDCALKRKQSPTPEKAMDAVIGYYARGRMCSTRVDLHIVEILAGPGLNNTNMVLFAY